MTAKPCCCELCQRAQPLSFHHIPRRNRRRRYFQKRCEQGLSQRRLWLCRLCHPLRHRTVSECALGLELNTREALRADSPTLDLPRLGQSVSPPSPAHQERRRQAREERFQRFSIPRHKVKDFVRTSCYSTFGLNVTHYGFHQSITSTSRAPSVFPRPQASSLASSQRLAASACACSGFTLEPTVLRLEFFTRIIFTALKRLSQTGIISQTASAKLCVLENIQPNPQRASSGLRRREQVLSHPKLGFGLDCHQLRYVLSLCIPG